MGDTDSAKKGPSVVKRIVDAGKNVGLAGAIALAPLAAPTKSQAADAAPGQSAAANTVPAPSAEQIALIQNTGEFAVEKRETEEGLTYNLLVTPKPPMPIMDKGSLTKQKALSQMLKTSLEQLGYNDVKVVPATGTIPYSPVTDENRDAPLPAQVTDQAGTMRRPAEGTSEADAVDKGFVSGLVLEVEIGAIPDLAPSQMFRKLERDFGGLQKRVGEFVGRNLPTNAVPAVATAPAPAAPAPVVAAPPAQPAPPPPADTFTVPDQLTVEQQRLARNVNGFMMERNGNKVTLTILPDSAIPIAGTAGSLFSNPTKRMNEWAERANALSSLGFNNVQFNPNNRPSAKLQVGGKVDDGTKYGNITSEPFNAGEPVNILDGKTYTVVPTITFELKNPTPESLKNAGAALESLLGKMTDRNKFDAEEKQRSRGR